MKKFNINPYYDDYDENKQFYKILFRPGRYALQARELTQIQSILQNQIEKQGLYNFKNGSIVYGGESFLNDLEYYYLNNSYDGVEITEELLKTFLGKKFQTEDGTKTIIILNYELESENTPFIIHVTNLSGLEILPSDIFLLKDTVEISSDLILGQIKFQIYSAPATQKYSGVSTNVFISEGIFFINSYFVYCPAQQLVISKDEPANGKIGLAVKEIIVDEKDDVSLLDPARGVDNYNSPGSHRYKIDLKLDKRPLEYIEVYDKELRIINQPDIDFIELLEIKNGIVEKQTLYPERGAIQKEIARTIRELHGNFYIDPFIPEVIDSPEESVDDPTFDIKIDPGVYYARGNRVETIADSFVEVKKARTYNPLVNQNINFQFGNYIVLRGLLGKIEVSANKTVTLINKVITGKNISEEDYDKMVIGHAKVRSVVFHENYMSSGTNKVKIRMYLYDIQMISGNIKDIMGIITSTYITDLKQHDVIFKGDVDTDSLDKNVETFLGDTKYNTTLYKMPYDVIRSIREEGKTINEGGLPCLSYQYQKLYQNVSIKSGISVPIFSPSARDNFIPAEGEISRAIATQNYIIIIKSGTYTNPDGIKFMGGSFLNLMDMGITLSIDKKRTAEAPDTLRIKFDSGSNKTFTGIVDIYVNLIRQSARERQKLLDIRNLNFKFPNIHLEKTDNLYTSDIHKIIGIYDSADPDIFIIPSNYIINPITGDLEDEDGNIAFLNRADFYDFDNGQRDNTYEYGNITLKRLSPAPEGQLLVIIEYFNHVYEGNSPLITVNSYNDINYADIPNFTNSSGELLELRDYIDLRIKRSNTIFENETSTITHIIEDKDEQGNIESFNGVLTDNYEEIDYPVPYSFLNLDYSYYLGRIDRLILNENYQFQLVEGVSSLKPEAPHEPFNSISLFYIKVPAYTFNTIETTFEMFEHKGYTMDDIGEIDQRVKQLEYYTSLTRLEQDTKNLIVRTEDGEEIFKNGILIDSFEGHSIGDVNNPDYDCAIDYEKNELRAPFENENYELEYKPEISKDVAKADDIITLPFTTKPFLEQPLATKWQVVNPFALNFYLGIVRLFPGTDNWFSRENRPYVKANINGINNNWISRILDRKREAYHRTTRKMRERGYGTMWDEWESLWYGRSIAELKESNSPLDKFGASNPMNPYGYTKAIKDMTKTNTRKGISKWKKPGDFSNIFKKDDRKLINLGIQPLIRDRTLAFYGKSFKPNTKLNAFFDKINVDKTLRPAADVMINYKTSRRFGLYEMVEVYEVNEKGHLLSTTRLGTGRVALNDLYCKKCKTTDKSYILKITDISDPKAFTPEPGKIKKIFGTRYGDINIKDGKTWTYLPAGIIMGFDYKEVGEPLITDDRGRCAGEFTIHPRMNYFPVRVGRKVFRLIDKTQEKKGLLDKLENIRDTLTNGDAEYFASGGGREINGLFGVRGLLRRRNSIDTEFIYDNVMDRDLNGTTRSKKWVDPYSQIFTVDENEYPEGCFITSVDLFFKDKDEDFSIKVEIRPADNDYPDICHSLPFSEIELEPEDVIVISKPKNVKEINENPTTFTFEAPVYLRGGKQYALAVMCHSNKYKIYTSEVGQRVIGSNVRATAAPYFPLLLKAQNLMDWKTDSEENFMMKIHRASFDITKKGEAYFSSLKQEEETIHLMNCQISSMYKLPSTENNFYYRGVDVFSGQYDTDYYRFPNKENLYFINTKRLKEPDDLKIKIVLESEDERVSPVIDIENSSFIGVHNVINDGDLIDSDFFVVEPGEGFDITNPPNTYDGSISVIGTGSDIKATAKIDNDGKLIDINVLEGGKGYYESPEINVYGGGSSPFIIINGETNNAGGNAEARYITRKVELTTGYISNTLRVFIEAYKPYGTNIEVYYKAKHIDDPDPFDYKPYKRMKLKTNLQTQFSEMEDDIIEYEYYPNNVELDDPELAQYKSLTTSTFYDGYSTFAIKITMYSSNPQTVPIISLLRAITGIKSSSIPTSPKAIT